MKNMKLVIAIIKPFKIDDVLDAVTRRSDRDQRTRMSLGVPIL